MTSLFFTFSFLLVLCTGWSAHANPNPPKPMYMPELTRSPSFLGLYLDGNGVWNITNKGKGVIIGMIDTGVMYDHPSFEDNEMSPPPPRWKGACEFNQPGGCNKKLIGARSFIRHPVRESPLDQIGHGTYTSSVVAGRLVKDIYGDEQGNANGSFIGIAPLAHIAMYKVCSLDSCDDRAILDGINAAIEDGVDIISISLGSYNDDPLYNNAISIGAFRAAQKGILVSKSAGNYGPDLRTINDPAPWVLTVAASNIDRRISAIVKIGNGMQFTGESLTQKLQELSMTPLVFPGNTGDLNATLCVDDKFGGVDVKGKIVMCEDGGLFRFDYSDHVTNAGGIGVIIMNNEANAYSTHPQLSQLPTANIDHESGLKIKAYIQSTKNPLASITFDGTITTGVRAPSIASFSSRGPCRSTPGIMKPDIIGPGVGILGAYPEPLFKIESGTSCACPHLSGVAALLKSMHPNWTGAMIKSAMMTTAYVTDNTGSPILDEKNSSASYFAMGAGHVNADKATDPGLVYDIKPTEYLSYLCGLGYNASMISKITGGDDSQDECSTSGSIAEYMLNYPSIIVPFTSKSNEVVIERRVTNVGDANSKYWLDIELPDGVEVVVIPNRLYFTQLREEMKFKMTFKSYKCGNELNMAQGQLKWVSPKHVVRSPISIMFDLPSPLS